MRAGRQLLVASVATLCVLAASPAVAQPAHAGQLAAGGVLFYYALVPTALVAAHLPRHPEGNVHGEAARSGDNQLLLALFDAADGRRIVEAQVMAHISFFGIGPGATWRLEAMEIGGQVSFGGFVPVGAPGIYRIRFEVQRPGIAGKVSAEFQHRTLRSRPG